MPPDKHPHDRPGRSNHETERLRLVRSAIRSGFAKGKIKPWDTRNPPPAELQPFVDSVQGHFRIAPEVVGKELDNLSPQEVLVENLDPKARATVIRVEGVADRVPYPDPPPAHVAGVFLVALLHFCLPFGAIALLWKRRLGVSAASFVVIANALTFPYWFKEIPGYSYAWTESPPSPLHWTISLTVLALSLLVLRKGRIQPQLVS